MTISLWVSILIAVVAGVFGGVLAPTIAHELSISRWKKEKGLELKFSAFEGAVNAVAKWEADAMDPDLQQQNREQLGTRPSTKLSPQTSEALEHYKGMVEALFSKSVSSKYRELLRSHISIESIPNQEFEKLRAEFVKLCSDELDLG